MEPSTGASNVPFPIKLRAMLAETEAKGLSHIVSWEMEGTAFRVHEPEEFVKQIMRQWFNQTKYKSFQRVRFLPEYTQSKIYPSCALP